MCFFNICVLLLYKVSADLMYIWKIWRFEGGRITRSKHVDRTHRAAQKSLVTRCLTCCLLHRFLSSDENPVTVTRSYFFVNFLLSFINLFAIGQAMQLQIMPCVSYMAWFKTVRDESSSTLVTGPDATVRVQTRCSCNRHSALSSSAWFTVQLPPPPLIFYWTLRYCIH